MISKELSIHVLAVLTTLSLLATPTLAPLAGQEPGSQTSENDAPPLQTFQQEQGDDLGIEIITPRDGDTFDTDDDVQVAGVASGNVSKINVTVEDEELEVEDKEKWHTRWNGSDNEGTYLVTAQVTDDENRTANDSVNIEVETEEADPAIDPDPDPDPEAQDGADTPALTPLGVLATVAIAALITSRR